MSDPIKLFVENTTEVRTLVKFHEEITGTGPGRRAGVEVLNKSGIVLLAACWEAFVEDCASTAFEFVLDEVKDPGKLPKVVRQRVARFLKEDKNELAVWNLAKDGWKDALRTFKQRMLHTHVSFFNTPKAGNVDALFDTLLGLPNLSKCWHWQGMSVTSAKRRLADYIELRGAIAHRVKTSNSVHKSKVTNFAEFITRLAVRTANVVRRHVRSLVGKYPWNGYKYGEFQ